MSFSMSQIKKKSCAKQDNIKNCYHFIYNKSNLTDAVKLALWKYCDYRFKNRNTGTFTQNRLDKMLDELLVKICNEKYDDININDIIQNENELVYQIKRAIYFGSTKSLYYEIDNANLDNLATSIIIEKPPTQRMTTDQVKDYFKDVMV